MDSKTRVLKSLAHEKPDRPAFNFWMDRRLMQQYEDRIGHRHWRVVHYDADVIETFPKVEFPAGRFGESLGVPWLVEPYPVDWSRVDEVPMPDAGAEGTFDLVEQDLKEFPDRAVVMNFLTPFGVLGNMLGHEKIYLDMMDHQEEMGRLAERIGKVMEDVIDRACSSLDITALYIQEDVSSAKGPMMSLDMIRRYCFDYAQRMVEIAKSHGKAVLFHCCGSIMPLMDEFVRIGVDAVNPLQPHLNDIGEFGSRYGDKLALYGGLDNTYIISQGSVDEVRAHIQDVFEKVGKKDGALIFSTHDLDIKTPPENIEVMVETIKGCRF